MVEKVNSLVQVERSKWSIWRRLGCALKWRCCYKIHFLSLSLKNSLFSLEKVHTKYPLLEMSTNDHLEQRPPSNTLGKTHSPCPYNMQAANESDRGHSSNKQMPIREEIILDQVQSATHKIRLVTLTVKAASRFKLNGVTQLCGIAAGLAGIADLGIESIARTHDVEKLKWLGGVDRLAELLETNPQTGISLADEGEVARRRRQFGVNVHPRAPSKTLWRFFCEACKDVTLNILILCAILSLVFGVKSEGGQQGWYDGVSILFAVLLVVVVTAVSDFRQSRQFQSLDKERENIQMQVVRAGRRVSASIFDIVVGDVVELRVGDQVPADGLFLRGQCLAIDESSMTGEGKLSLPDSEQCPFLWSGCKVEDGYGSMLVTAVGMDTEWGSTMATIAKENNEETPLQTRLRSVATLIGKVGFAVATLVLIVLFIFYFTGHASSNSGQRFHAGETSASQVLNSIVNIFSIAVTIVVVAVPEGLPLAVTLSLAYSMRKMMADKALVRRLSACETMGSATYICSDKTGTLTMNKMTVVKAWIAGRMSREAAHAGIDCVMTTKKNKNTRDLLFEGIAQNTTGSVFLPQSAGSIDQAEVSGSPTEKALLRWGLKLGMRWDEARSESSVVKVETFNSTKKCSGVALKMGDGRVIVHWKGAAEVILSACSKWENEEHTAPVDMSTEKRKEVQNMIDGMASSSLRCIAFACCEVPSDAFLSEGHLPQSDLTLLAVVGMTDPCRPGVREAVQLVKAAGVKVIMVTGDNLATAKAIATKCSILQTGDLTVVGATFRGWDDTQMRQRLPQMSVLARALPSDKVLLVKALQSMGEVVAVTGDGTNDAAALHQANIGLSMGIEGTEVAKQSSDIIILDDNFATIVRVVQWGRSVYSNIQKFLQFQLTVNVVALAVNFMAAVTSGSVPLTAVQLLWVNLIMDTLGALALATEPPADDLMSRSPVYHEEPLLTNTMWRNLAFQAVYQVAVLLTLQFHGESLLHLHEHSDAALINRTIIFNTFVLCQVFNEVNTRHLHNRNIFQGILRSHLFVGIVASTLVLQVVMVEFLGKFASTVRLDWQHWLVCIGLASMAWPIAFLVKSMPVPDTPMFRRPEMALHT